ncbi:MAG: HtaA domain-containing protein [Leucobacter sp.]|nr:HtaA domain-containing protein [Leucobacter sp.]
MSATASTAPSAAPAPAAPRPRGHRLGRPLALLTAALVALSGLVAAPAAQAAPVPSVEAPVAEAPGDEILPPVPLAPAEAPDEESLPPAPLAPAEPQATTLALTASVPSLTLGESVTLTAQVDPAADGTVEFSDGNGLVGSAAVAGGSAVLTVTPTAIGNVSYTAGFVPGNPAEFSPSTSPGSVLVVVLEPAGPGGDPVLTPEPDGSGVEGGLLEWGVYQRFISYVESPIAEGRVTALAPTTRAKNVFAFPQVSSQAWDRDTGTGTLSYAGAVHFFGHGGALDFSFANPEVVVTSADSAELAVTTGGARVVLAELDLTRAQRSELEGGAVRWESAPATLTAAGAHAFLNNYPAGEALDPVTFVAGADADVAPVEPPGKTGKPKADKTKHEKPAKTRRTTSAKEAGSLSWGISSGFAAYTTGSIAKGVISTAGVGRSGGGYVFPQATGGDWDVAAQTGTIRFSGVVSFLGHEVAGTYLMTETFANPVITVRNARTGTISAGGRTFGLDLAAAAKTVTASGAVTWSNVPVIGQISGGGSSGAGAGGGTFAADPLTFTVGAVNRTGYGSTTESNPARSREPAPAAPATSGITLLTPPDQLVAGGDIEFQAAGFQADERDILVVIYSEPVLLDRHAGADANGVVRWSGTLPKGLHGEHTITLQGSTDAGAVLDIMTQREYDALHAERTVADEGTIVEEPVAAGIGTVAGAPGSAGGWGIWAGALGLLVVAAGMTALAVRQRRRNV